jgi:uncharacterized protein (DUF433 family)
MNDFLGRITIDASICHGKPCVRGLRYPVENLLELLSSGMTHEEILADYEDLSREDLLAVIAFRRQVCVEEAAEAGREFAAGLCRPVTPVELMDEILS